jgi:RNA polymerase sigma-70 factor, ECF subfamily
LASQDEFEEFVAGALPGLLRFGHVLAGDRATAEDLVQIALGRSWRAWRLRRIDNLPAFVRKVMVNRYASWYRRPGFANEVVSASPAGPALAEDEIHRVDDRDEVWRALALLPPRQRAVVILRYYEDKSEQEIAAIMGTSAGTVKSQSARALRRLAGLLEDPDPARQPARGAPHD